MAVPTIEDLPLLVMIICGILGGAIDKSTRLSHPLIRTAMIIVCFAAFGWWVYTLQIAH